MMTPRDVFGLIVRTVGLLTIIYGVHHLMGALAYMLNLEGRRPGVFDVGSTGGVVKWFAVQGAGYIAVGSCLFKWADALADACYPPADIEDESDGAGDTAG